MTERAKEALQGFASGRNCAQAVLCAYSDVVGLTKEQAAMVASGFGGGMGRLRQNCGAYSAAVMLCGALEGADGGTKAKRPAVYARVQQVNAAFIRRMGTVNCGELLGRLAEQPTPEERTPAYYASRPCAGIIRKTCEMLDDMMARQE